MIRDESNNAIININTKAYDSYIERYKNKYNEIKKMTDYDNQLSELKNEINDIKNLLKQGLKIILSGSGIESDIKQKQVEALSLDKSMKPETH